MALKISHSCDSYQYVEVHAGLPTPYSQVLVPHFEAYSSILVLLISSFSLNSLRLRGFPSRSCSAFLESSYCFSRCSWPLPFSPSSLCSLPAVSAHSCRCPDPALSAAMFSLLFFSLCSLPDASGSPPPFYTKNLPLNQSCWQFLYRKPLCIDLVLKPSHARPLFGIGAPGKAFAS